MMRFNQEGFALESGEITVYVADSQGIFSHQATEFISEGGSLAAGSYLDAPPKAKDGFVIMREGSGWVNIKDNRGVYYDTRTGEKVEISELKKTLENLTALAPLTVPCFWNGNAWQPDEEKMAEQKALQQAEIWEQIKAKRTANGRGGIYVASVAKWFHSDDNSRQQYTFMRTLPTLPDTQWKTMDNSFVTMNKALLEELSMAMFAHEQADFANAERHLHAMLQVENPLDYDYSTGWASIYEEK